MAPENTPPAGPRPQRTAGVDATRGVQPSANEVERAHEGGQHDANERDRRQRRTKFARNMDGYQILLYRGFLAVLEVGLSVTNAINSEAWAFETFAHYVFAASAVMESLGLAFSLLLMVIHRDVSNIGQPLTILSGLVSKQVARRLERGWFKKDVWFSGGSPEHLLYVFMALSLSNGVFLIMYLVKYQRAVLYWILIVVVCFSVLLSIVWVRMEDGGFSRDILAYLDGLSVVVPLIILLLGVVFSPIILELLESITLLTAEIDDRDVSENTIELIILDIVMVIPFVMVWRPPLERLRLPNVCRGRFPLFTFGVNEETVDLGGADPSSNPKPVKICFLEEKRRKTKNEGRGWTTRAELLKKYVTDVVDP